MVRKKLAVIVFGALLALAAATSASAAGRHAVGSAVKTVAGLVGLSSDDGAVNDSNDGDVQDGNTDDGALNDSNDGDVQDGNTDDGAVDNTDDGAVNDSNDGDVQDGNTDDGDVQDGNTDDGGQG